MNSRSLKACVFFLFLLSFNNVVLARGTDSLKIALPSWKEPIFLKFCLLYLGKQWYWILSEDIDYSATNEYDFQNYFLNPDGFDSILVNWHNKTATRPFLSVELCVNDGKFQTESYRIALTMGQLYQKNLVLANAVLLGHCWNILNIEQPSFGATRSLFIISPENGFVPEPSSNQPRVFGAYSRRIKAGMQRVEVENTNKSLKIVAFKAKETSAQ